MGNILKRDVQFHPTPTLTTTLVLAGGRGYASSEQRGRTARSASGIPRESRRLRGNGGGFAAMDFELGAKGGVDEK